MKKLITIFILVVAISGCQEEKERLAFTTSYSLNEFIKCNGDNTYVGHGISGGAYINEQGFNMDKEWNYHISEALRNCIKQDKLCSKDKFESMLKKEDYGDWNKHKKYVKMYKDISRCRYKALSQTKENKDSMTLEF
jgi:hypothetical protein